MSEQTKFTPGPAPSGTVVLGFGPQPIDWLTKASKLCGKGAVMDPIVAHMAGANLAAGSREALDALRQRLEAGSLQATKQAYPGLSEAASRWLASGERGVSSNTMFTHMTGINALGDWRGDVPHDPADFRRCRLLLEQVPELADRVEWMRAVSSTWNALVDAWPTICAAMDAECPEWRSNKGGMASKTYELIKKAIGR